MLFAESKDNFQCYEVRNIMSGGSALVETSSLKNCSAAEESCVLVKSVLQVEFPFTYTSESALFLVELSSTELIRDLYV